MATGAGHAGCPALRLQRRATESVADRWRLHADADPADVPLHRHDRDSGRLHRTRHRAGRRWRPLCEGMNGTMPDPIRLIVDTDTAGDDCTSLLIALRSPGVTVEAITINC